MIAVDPNREDALMALRRATADRHDFLDKAMPLAKQDPTLADYRDHLLLLYAWLMPLENWLAAFDDGPQTAGLFPDAHHIGLISRDLADIATLSIDESDNGSNAGVAKDPICTEWPQHASSAYRWGVCYVVEGSQLGGAVLYRRLAAKLAPHPLRYLNGNSTPTGSRWKSFITELRHAVSGTDSIKEACQGACDAFDRLIELKHESKLPQ